MTKKIAVIASIYYLLTYMAGAIFTSYASLYYVEIGLNNGQIGTIGAVIAVIALVAQPLMGTVSDKSVRKNGILKFVVLMAGLTVWLIPLAKGKFLLILAAVAVFSFFNSTINPLGDAITLEIAHKEGLKFSKIRMVGSLGYAIMAAVAGKVFSISILYMFPMIFAIRLMSFGLSFLLPIVKGYKNSKNPIGFMELFKDKKLILLYSYIFILSCTFGFFISFHAVYSKQVGISTELIGLGVMIGSISQFPFMAFFDKIYKKVGMNKILIFSGCAYGIRWLLFATVLTPYTILFLWALHGLNFMIVYLCITEYVNTSVPKELHTRGQMMNSIILSGVSSIVGGYFGGVLSTYVGLRQIFMACAIIAFGAVLIFYVVSKTIGLEARKDNNMAV